MDFLKMIFALIYKFVPIEPADFAKLKEEAFMDWSGVRTDSEAPEKGIKFWVKKYSEKWEVRLGLAVAYIFLIRMISDWMNPAVFDDDDDDEDERSERRRRF